MLACIPTNGSAGLEDTVSDHFGSAPCFTLFDSETSEVTVLENRNAHHSHGTCHPMIQLARYKIDCIVCSGMGRRAVEALTSEGIKIYQAESDKVSETVNKLNEGSLTEIDPAKACRGHGQSAELTSSESVPARGRGAGYGQGGCRHQGQGSEGGRRRGQG
ncbi:MAG: NifB/NifX family molybdenum-iron cluster-binding protein [candidate division Zixibacteria bacterium]|nr:NifB/NifX family molybdenum-iron cluster-binding protein [candidate division Zixibacteria bacterium]MBU1470532.1 NifB/NifX family molybdenum-iron cluster-binding protein [candidate division Zixibacteria bacterium]MBU2626880.1 NifB/NifX family molybdenum-iron cluster-binding protein [candidate division Zixibacteria bacterium]